MINWFKRNENNLDKLTSELRNEGPRQFAKWSNEAFDSYLEEPVANLKRSLESRDKKKQDHASLTNYLRMVYEGVGAGWLKTINWETPSPTFLAHCLSRLVPYQLRKVPVEERADVLRNVWNLGEGMAREPQWLNQYAITQTNWSTDITKLQEHLETILEPVLSQTKNATWKGKYNLNVINLRNVSDGFLPGRMFLASPAVLCVENELDQEETIGILLRHPSECKVLGIVGKLPEHSESFTPPSIELSSDAILINGIPISAPFLSAPHRSLCAATGFVAVTAEDSQRLWLVEVA